LFDLGWSTTSIVADRSSSLTVRPMRPGGRDNQAAPPTLGRSPGSPHHPPSPMSLSPLIADYDHFLLDLDGTVWVGDVTTAGAGEALAALRTAEKAIAFVTNDSARAPEDYVRKLWSLGLRASVGEVVSVGSALQYFLAQRPVPAQTFVIGSPAVFRHVADAGQRIVNGTPRAAQADLVVIAAHEGFDYAELRTATQAVLGGAEMLAAGRDATYPTGEGQWPGTGAVVAALEYATGVHAHSVGKPDRLLFETALDRLGPGRPLMVGDRLDADLAGAAAAGIDCAIVLTGVSSRAEAQDASAPAPVAIAEDLRELVLG
jgi:glycerol-1-phosphatase